MLDTVRAPPPSSPRLCAGALVGCFAGGHRFVLGGPALPPPSGASFGQGGDQGDSATNLSRVLRTRAFLTKGLQALLAPTPLRSRSRLGACPGCTGAGVHPGGPSSGILCAGKLRGDMRVPTPSAVTRGRGPSLRAGRGGHTRAGVSPRPFGAEGPTHPRNQALRTGGSKGMIERGVSQCTASTLRAG